ncbi:hypothetical protein RND71_026162 [Anisodus tanguticus]|uniref:Uncharacterized protein n=1 Tax=Anisodus tanguticus TaxID=243964 RepID=A0AAE1RLP6_9SOLA|nr:hypothetical protein RND71_026162 [Anisodus tanguticus]
MACWLNMTWIMSFLASWKISKVVSALIVILNQVQPRLRKQLVELLDSLLGNLHDLLKCCVEFIYPLKHICFTNLKASESAEEVGRFIKQLLEASPDILRAYLIHLQEKMFNVTTARISARNIHVMIEFLLIILSDMPEEFIHHDKLSFLLARTGALTRDVSMLVRNLEEISRNEENMNETCCGRVDLLENIKLLKEVFLEAHADSSQLCFPKSDGPLFMTLIFRNLNDLLNSNA